MKSPSRLIARAAVFLSLFLRPAGPAIAAGPATREITLEVSELTTSDVAVSPDGAWVAFTLLGHVFRVPVAGGRAEQLTFGIGYEREPVFSPDGKSLAFVSDREGNPSVFLLDLGTRKLQQLSKDPVAAHPAFFPDGSAVVYVRLAAQSTAHGPDPEWMAGEIRRKLLGGDSAEILTAAPASQFSGLFFLPDKRLAWVSVVQEPNARERSSRIQVLETKGQSASAQVLRAVAGVVDRVALSPSGRSVVVRRRRNDEQGPEELVEVPLGPGAERTLATLPGGLPGRRWRPAHAVLKDAVLVAEKGALRRYPLSGGEPSELKFGASVKLELLEPAAALADAGSRTPPILSISEAPSGALVFASLGNVYRQPARGTAEALPLGPGLHRDPALSPDGETVAFVTRLSGKEALRILDKGKTAPRALLEGGDYASPSFSASGDSIVFEERVKGGSRIVVLPVKGGTPRTLVEGLQPGTRPQLSQDGKSVTYTSRNAVLRLPLTGGRPRTATRLPWPVRDAVFSPDGKLLMWHRNREVFQALAGELTTKSSSKSTGKDPVDAFGFSPKSDAFLLSSGGRVFRQVLATGKRTEVPVKLPAKGGKNELRPVLLKRVRLFDPVGRTVGAETTLLLENGRISRRGDAEGPMPKGAIVLDAEGRVALPGLVDSAVDSQKADLQALLAEGVTTVRDAGGSVADVRSLAARAELPGEALPRIVAGGEVLEYLAPEVWNSYQAIGPEDVAAAAARVRTQGLPYLALSRSLSDDLSNLAAREAAKAGVSTVWETMTAESLVRAVTRGAGLLEGTPGPEPLGADLLGLLGKTKRFWIPNGGTVPPDAPAHLVAARAKGAAETVRALREAGWPLLPASAGHPGRTVHTELEGFVAAGATPLEALAFATLDASRALGLTDSGTLEKGMRADLLLLEADPTNDIRNAARVFRVIRNGTVFDPATLGPR
ncbi:MAG: PD40 domain-containing protein [Acidobacteria bacterium]|nr:PD40 domain-containing protein [Acidobacteriota bacterium]